MNYFKGGGGRGWKECEFLCFLNNGFHNIIQFLLLYFMIFLFEASVSAFLFLSTNILGEIWVYKYKQIFLLIFLNFNHSLFKHLFLRTFYITYLFVDLVFVNFLVFYIFKNIFQFILSIVPKILFFICLFGYLILPKGGGEGD